MIKKLKQILLTAVTASIIFMPALVPATALASNGNIDINGNLCGGTNAESGTDSSACGGANSKVGQVMTNVINFFSLLVGIVSVVMIIIGGFKYIVSNGDSSQISSAKTTIIFALVGLIVVAMAQFIVHFVLGKVVPNISGS